MWECAGPRGAATLMLIHGVAGTAELNWGKVLAPLGCHFRVIAADLRGHGDGIRAGPRFRLEDCADDIAALAGVLGLGRFAGSRPRTTRTPRRPTTGRSPAAAP